MDKPMNLSLEQEFGLKNFANQVERMSREQAQEFLINLRKQMMMRENMYQEFLKHEWGLDSGPMSA